MQHNLDRIALSIVLIALAPVVADGVGEDAARFVECGSSDAAPDVGIALEAVFGVLVPKVEGAVGTGCAEGAVYGVEGNVVDGVHIDDIVDRRISMTLEGKVGTMVVTVSGSHPK